MVTYAQAISLGFPGVVFLAPGDGSIYESIEWISGTPPTKEQLDEWIDAEGRNEMWKKIQAERERRKWNGVKVGTNWFHSDDTSRIQQIGLLLMGVNMPNNIMWKTMTGSFVQMTPTLAQQIFQAISAQDIAIFAAAEQHRALMMASATPETYNYLTGWPLTFGE